MTPKVKALANDKVRVLMEDAELLVSTAGAALVWDRDDDDVDDVLLSLDEVEEVVDFLDDDLLVLEFEFVRIDVVNVVVDVDLVDGVDVDLVDGVDDASSGWAVTDCEIDEVGVEVKNDAGDSFKEAADDVLEGAVRVVEVGAVDGGDGGGGSEDAKIDGGAGACGVTVTVSTEYVCINGKVTWGFKSEYDSHTLGRIR